MFRVLVISSISFLASFGSAAQESGAFGVFGNYRLSPVSVNSPGNEYAPVLSNGDLLFTSDNREQLGMYVSATDTASRLMSLFRARQIDDTLFEAPVLLDNRLSRFTNSGPGTLTTTGERVFFSANEETAFLVYTARRKAKLKIYTLAFDGKKWSERELLPFAADDANYTHPFATAGGDTLFFASDRAGGFGGYDLYRSVLRDGTWSEPHNLGAAINSPWRELFPSVAGGVLWYSTDNGSSGGLDLRSAHLAKMQIADPGAPFNSPADDFGYFPVNARKGYFSSNRSGNDELYFYNQLFPDFHDCEPYVKDKFCYTFFEETEELDTGLALVYEWSMGDGTVIREREAHHCFDGYGEYLVELNIIDRTTSEVYFTEASYPFAIEPTERLHLEGPDTVPTGAEVVFSGIRSAIPDRAVTGFYWELDDGQRWSQVDTIVLSFATEGTRTLLLGVEAEDESGNVETFCVTRQIVAKENYIAVLPLSFPPKGETSFPLEVGRGSTNSGALYTLFLGVSDTLIEDLSLNDSDTVRVEPVGDSLYLYSVGATNDKLGLLEEYRDARELGFPDTRVTELSADGLLHEEQLSQTEIVQPGELLDTRILTEQVAGSLEVFYGYNVHTLTPENKRRIAELTAAYPLTGERRVLISSFTDSKGDDAYNLELSKKRSESVRKALIAGGYPADRIELEYFGRRVPQDMEPLTDAQRRKSLIIVYEKK